MVSKETQSFLSPFWLRWEPVLARKSDAVLSTTGLHAPCEPPAKLCLLLPREPGQHFHFCPQ